MPSAARRVAWASVILATTHSASSGDDVRSIPRTRWPRAWSAATAARPSRPELPVTRIEAQGFIGIRGLSWSGADDFASDDDADAVGGVFERVAIVEGDVAVLSGLEGADAIADA